MLVSGPISRGLMEYVLELRQSSVGSASGERGSVGGLGVRRRLAVGSVSRRA